MLTHCMFNIGTHSVSSGKLPWTRVINSNHVSVLLWKKLWLCGLSGGGKWALSKKYVYLGFTSGFATDWVSQVAPCKESTCQCRIRGFDPWAGKTPWGRKWKPTTALPGNTCLGNSMDRGPWRATVHRVTKSRTRLSKYQQHFMVQFLNCKMEVWYLVSVYQWDITGIQGRKIWHCEGQSLML